MHNVIVIGIAGGTGSGKSTMIHKIKEEFHDDIAIHVYPRISATRRMNINTIQSLDFLSFKYIILNFFNIKIFCVFCSQSVIIYNSIRT